MMGGPLGADPYPGRTAFRRTFKAFADLCMLRQGRYHDVDFDDQRAGHGALYLDQGPWASQGPPGEGYAIRTRRGLPHNARDPLEPHLYLVVPFASYDEAKAAMVLFLASQT